MSLSIQNNVVTADNCCESVYKLCNSIASCADFLHIKTNVTDSDVTIRFVDKFKRTYYHDVTTDAQGYAVIDLETLPKGLLNEYAGTFRVSVVYNGTVIQFTASDGLKYDAIDFSCKVYFPKQANTYIDISK